MKAQSTKLNPGRAPEMQNLSSFVWSIAEILRGDFKQSEYGKVVVDDRPYGAIRGSA